MTDFHSAPAEDKQKSLKPATFSISKEELRHEYVIRHQYDPQNHLYNLLQVRGTALQFVLTAKTFWGLVVMNTVVFVGWTFLSPETQDSIREDWSLKSGYIQSLSSLVVFTIVFYTGNCYVVYKDLFHIGCKVSRRIVMLTMHLKSIFRNEEDVWASVRHMIAAQRVFYYELKAQMAEYHGDGPGSETHPGKWEEWAMEKLVRKNLIKPREASVLTKYEGKKITLLSGWAQTSFFMHMKHNEHYLALSPPLQSQFLRVAMQENENVQELLTATKETKEFGVPFVYHHIVHLLTLCYLILLSFNNLFIDAEHAHSYWALITYPVVCFVMQGILSAADAMADPFGDDDCDFNLDALTIITYNDVAQLIDFINTDEAIMDSIAVKHVDKPKMEPKLVKANGGAPKEDVFAAMRREGSLESPELFKPPVVPEGKPSVPIPEHGGSPSMQMMQMMLESVKLLGDRNHEQAELLKGWQDRMAMMMGDVRSEAEAAGRREGVASKDNGGGIGFSRASSRGSQQQRRRIELGHASPSGRSLADLAKRTETDGVEMTSRPGGGIGVGEARKRGENGGRELGDVEVTMSGSPSEDDDMIVGLQ